MPDVMPAGNSAPLVWAMHFPPEGAPREVEDLRLDQPGWVWAHFDLVHAGIRPAIEALDAVPQEARELLLGTDDSQRLTADQGMVAGVLPAFASAAFADGGAASAGEIVMWHFVLLPGMLITARRTPLRTLLTAWEAARKGHTPVSPGALVHSLMSEFAIQARHEVDGLSDALEDVEEALLAAKPGSDLAGATRTLGHTRRATSRLRRAVVPMLRLLRDEAMDWPAWATSDAQETVLRHVLTALDDLHSLQERAHILLDELSARRAEETNRRLYLMSIVTTLVMPAALVTGYFGMNTGALPWGGEFPMGTIYATVVMVGSVLITLALLRFRRLL